MAPFPPCAGAIFPSPAPPSAPTSRKVAECTPFGTVQVCAPTWKKESTAVPTPAAAAELALATPTAAANTPPASTVAAARRVRRLVVSFPVSRVWWFIASPVFLGPRRSGAAGEHAAAGGRPRLSRRRQR